MKKARSIQVNRRGSIDYVDRKISKSEVDEGRGVVRNTGEITEPDHQMMTNEHNTVFYDEVTRKNKDEPGEVKGFLLRGNFFDRL